MRIRIFLKVSIVASAFFQIFPLIAFNGLFQTSYGARQAGLAGGTSALGNSVMDLENNPSHLGRLNQRIIEAGTSLHSARLGYTDMMYNPDPQIAYSNNLESRPVAALPYAGFVMPLTDSLGFGIAVYAQGGGGGEFKGIIRNTPSGNSLNEIFQRDIPGIGNQKKILEDIQFRFMNMKLTTGIGYKLGKFSVGLGLDAAYAEMHMSRRMYDFSRTIEVPGGFKYDSQGALAAGGKLGLSLQATDNFRFAYSYSTKNVFHLDGNLRTSSLSIYEQRETGVSRTMTWPERHTLGLAYIRENWLLTGEIKYIPWSQAFRTEKFILEDSYLTTPIGSKTNTILMQMKWRNQLVFSVGGEIRLFESHSLRAGYNYGKTPIPSEGINPMLGALTEHHLALGYGKKWENLELNVAYERAFPKAMDGTKGSEWSLSHAVLPDRRVNQFNHSKQTDVNSIFFGIKKYM